MKFIELLHRTWLGHPLHPVMVNVPIGAWFAAFVLDLIAQAQWVHPDAARRLALYCVALGLVGAVIAAPFALADWFSSKKTKPAKTIGFYRLVVELGATGVWGINLGLRLAAVGPRPNAGILSTSILATLLVLIGGYLSSLTAFAQSTPAVRPTKPELRAPSVRKPAQRPR